MGKTKFTTKESNLLKSLLSFKSGADKQIYNIRLLTYSTEEIKEISSKLYLSGINACIIKSGYKKEELRKFKIWNKLKEDKLYYEVLINYIKTLK